MTDRATYYQCVQEAEAFLRRQGIEDASVDAWCLLEYVTGMNRTQYLLRRTERMPERERKEYQLLIRKRGTHIPLQHLTGVQEFMGFSFQVNEHVLTPRQDTELLAEEALACLREQARRGGGLRVLDLCTGSGCLAVSLKKLCPACEMTASDISAEALEVARENGRRLEAAVEWIESDLFEKLEPDFDVIVSNPPYIRSDVIDTLSPEVRCHEPRQALDGYGDGLFFYRRILEATEVYLKAGGWLLFEIGFDQGAEVAGMMRQAGFLHVRVTKDLAGLDRVVSGQKPRDMK